MQWHLPEDPKARLGKGKISEIQYSSDGALLIVATVIGIWIYDTTTYQEGRTSYGTYECSQVLAFSPDGNILASADEAGTLLLWHRAQARKKCSPGYEMGLKT